MRAPSANGTSEARSLAADAEVDLEVDRSEHQSLDAGALASVRIAS
jgi:hypothetical protein